MPATLRFPGIRMYPVAALHAAQLPGYARRFVHVAASRIAFFMLVVLPAFLFAQSPAPIRISTQNTQLVLGVDTKGKLKQLYFGKPISEVNSAASFTAQAPDAYSTYGTTVTEAALRVTHGDGNLTTNLIYKTHTVSQEAGHTLTTIVLKDSYYPLEVSLFYRAYAREDIIEQWMELSHTEKEPVTLYNFASAGLSFYQQDAYLSYFYGDWANEFNMIEAPLQEGIKLIDSKLGVRTDQMTNPSFLLSLKGKLQEDAGEVVAGSLAWPGNFQLLFDRDHYGKLKVIAGMNPYASQYTLAPKTVFKTPALLYTYSDRGAGEVSRRFHRWARNYGMTDGHGTRDVLLNNWEATYFDFDEAKLSSIIQEAGQMGFDLFLLDDGWFGNKYPRNNDDAGLGDWEVNKKKLPHGIGYLVEQCKQNNIKFGIWVEPEMINPKSELYEKHPDWVITAANRELDPQRNQLILDLSNPAVQEYVYNVLDKLVSDNKGISYLKWDCNRYITNAGSKYLKDKQSHLFVEYPRAILRIMERFRKKYPHITMMVCSGGGGRIDYGSMKYFQEFWPSDNTDALDRVKIQWGLQYFFPATGLASHVSVTPNHITGRSTPLKFRFDVAMSGKLGMDLQPMQMTADEKEFSKKALQTYKNTIKPIVLQGDLYRLLSPYASDRAAIMYVTEDQRKAVVFNYLLHKKIYGEKTVLRLKGLKKNTTYTITELNKTNFSRVDAYEGKTFTGDFLETTGLQFDMYNEFESTTLLLTEHPSYN